MLVKNILKTFVTNVLKNYYNSFQRFEDDVLSKYLIQISTL